MELDMINENTVNPTTTVVELDEVFRRLYRERKWRLISLALGLVLWYALHSTAIYYPAFAGYSFI